MVALKTPGSDEKKQLDELLPLLAGKTSQGPLTIYVCQNFTCQAPLVGVEAVASALGGPPSRQERP